jgi:glycosyltransferase involved in cell wall biosynthesis
MTVRIPGNSSAGILTHRSAAVATSPKMGSIYVDHPQTPPSNGHASHPWTPRKHRLLRNEPVKEPRRLSRIVCFLLAALSVIAIGTVLLTHAAVITSFSHGFRTVTIQGRTPLSEAQAADWPILRTPTPELKYTDEELLQSHYLQAKEHAQKEAQRIASEVNDMKIVWELAASGCDGFVVETILFLVGLYRYIPESLALVARGDHRWCPGLDHDTLAILEELTSKPLDTWDIDIHVMHVVPHLYASEYPYKTPDRRYTLQAPRYRVGRSMYETRKIPQWMANQVNFRVDEVWLPSMGLVESFVDGGADPTKMVILPEAVDDRIVARPVAPLHLTNKAAYNFFSSFKLEARKNWQMLIRAFLEEFTIDDDVALFVHSFFHNTPSAVLDRRDAGALQQYVAGYINRMVEETGLDRSRLPVGKIHIIGQEMEAQVMPRIYQSMQAFVLPTHGEGWGLPIAEAMASGLPVVVTNWSGPVHFMNADNSLPIRVEGFVEAAGSEFPQGSVWAQPSLSHLREIMRWLYDDPERGRVIGARARYDMLTKYSIDAVAVETLKHIRRIRNKAMESTAVCQIYHDTVQFSADQGTFVNNLTGPMPPELSCCWRSDGVCEASKYLPARSLGCFDKIPPHNAGRCLCPVFENGEQRIVELQAPCSTTETFTCAQQCLYDKESPKP